MWAKKDICRNKKILKDLPNDKKIYISEDITKEAAEIHYRARQMVKTKDLWSTFTMDGDIYVKGQPTERKGTKITHIKELAYFTQSTTQRNHELDKQDSIEMVDGQRLELSRSQNDSLIRYT